MIFFLLHQMLQPLLSLGLWHQTANLFTFLVGMICWTYLWVYVSDPRFGGVDNFWMTGISQGFVYFILGDIMSVAIIYKNYWKQSIFTELEDLFQTKPKSQSQSLPISETLDSSPQSMMSQASPPPTNVEPSLSPRESLDTSEHFPQQGVVEEGLSAFAAAAAAAASPSSPS